jgi:hypothetical protein
MLNVGLISTVINVQLISSQRNDSPYLGTINVCMGMGIYVVVHDHCFVSKSLETISNMMCRG